jgi:energy-coupling factor transport system permease protein
VAGYDALRHVTIGQYIPTGSLIHRLDPRIKLIAFLVMVIAVIWVTTYTSNILLALYAIVLVWSARLSLRYTLTSIRPVLPVLVVLTLLQVLFYGGTGEGLLWAWGLVHISTAGLRLSVVSWLRFLDLLLLTNLLTSTTTTSSLTHGVESLLRPLAAIGLPAHEIALVLAIALRFIPILGEELETILQVQASRGVSLGSGGRRQFARQARRLAGVIVPLFVGVYRRAEEMILAMQARCYRGGRGRSRLVELHLLRTDYLALLVLILMIVGMVVLQYAGLP